VKKFNFHYFPRDFEAGDFIENFLVSAVFNVLFWRFYLSLAGWPKIIFGSFYIQHVLIGGMLMAIAMSILFVFLNREAKYLASWIGGAGFGIYIDEIGKYLTHDNNYFYQPAIAIIYVIIILIFLISRSIEKYFKPTTQEYATNALELAKNAIMHDLDTDGKQRALFLLKFTQKDDLVSHALEKALKSIRAVPIDKPHVFHLIKTYLKNSYLSLIRYKYFIRLTVGFFMISAIINFSNSIINFKNIESFPDWGQLVFSIVSGVLVISGSFFLIYKRSRRYAYEMFKYAVLTSIFLTQFFRFLENQLSAITVLLFSLVILSTLQYLIYEEKLLISKKKVHHRS